MSDTINDAEKQISIHDYKSAENILRKYLEENKTDAVVWNKLGKVLEVQKKYYEAIDAFAAAADLDQNNYEYCYNLGNILAEIHSYAEAKALFERAAELTDSLRPQFKVGDMLGYLGEYDKALVLYSLLLTKYPNEPGLYRRLAVVEKHLGRDTEAMANVSKEMEIRTSLVKTNPSASNWYKFADLKARLAVWNEAKAGFEKSLELEDSADTHMRLGAVLVMLNKHDEAMAEFEKAAEIDPFDFHFIMKLADELSVLKLYDTAITYYTKALELRSVHAEAWIGIAFALLKTNRKDEAKAFFEMAKASSAVRELPWEDKLHKSFKTDELDKELR